MSSGIHVTELPQRFLSETTMKRGVQRVRRLYNFVFNGMFETAIPSNTTKLTVHMV